MTERVAKRNLFVLFILLAVLAGMQLKNKAVHEWLERDFEMWLYDLKGEIGVYYHNHNSSCPEDISEFETWKSKPDSLKKECEFVGNRNVYRLKDGKLQKIILRSVKTWKCFWPFGRGMTQVMIEQNRYTINNGKLVYYSFLMIDSIPPKEIIELETPVPREFFVRQTLGKDAPSQEETLKDQAPTLDMANGV